MGFMPVEAHILLDKEGSLEAASRHFCLGHENGTQVVKPLGLGIGKFRVCIVGIGFWWYTTLLSR